MPISDAPIVEFHAAHIAIIYIQTEPSGVASIRGG